MTRLADTYIIGNVYIIDGKKVIVEEAMIDPCAGCAFYFKVRDVSCCALPNKLRGEKYNSRICNDVERTDNVSIIFKEIEDDYKNQGKE